MLSVLLLLSRLPLWWWYLCSDVLWRLLFYVLRYRRQVVEANLLIAFPNSSAKDRRRWARRYYRHLSDMLFEVLKALTMPKEELQRRVSFENRASVLRYLEAGRSVVLYASHQGNWEWVLAAGSCHLPWPVEAVVRPISSRLAARMMYLLRNVHYHIGAYDGQEALRSLLRRTSMARIYVIAGDQCPQQGDSKHWTSFFGRETPFFQGLERVPRLLAVPVFFLSIRRLRRGCYDIAAHLLDEPPYPPYRAGGALHLLPRYAEALESVIRSDPPYWLWSHRRWKYAKDSM